MKYLIYNWNTEKKLGSWYEVKNKTQGEMRCRDINRDYDNGIGVCLASLYVEENGNRVNVSI